MSGGESIRRRLPPPLRQTEEHERTGRWDVIVLSKGNRRANGPSWILVCTHMSILRDLGQHQFRKSDRLAALINSGRMSALKNVQKSLGKHRSTCSILVTTHYATVKHYKKRGDSGKIEIW
jgi:hypothetical protein